MINKIIKLQKLHIFFTGITTVGTLIVSIPVLSEFSEKFNNKNDINDKRLINGHYIPKQK